MRHDLPGEDATLTIGEEEALARHMAELYDPMLNGVSCGRVIYENGEPVDRLYIYVNAAYERVTGGKNTVDPEWMAVREDGSLFPGSEHPATHTLATDGALTGVVMGVGPDEIILPATARGSDPAAP